MYDYIAVNRDGGADKCAEDVVAAVKAEIERRGLNCQIQVDGGVSAANSKKLVEMGAEILVAGSAVFKAEDPAAVIAAMKE